MRLLVNTPVPVPSADFGSDIVGFSDLLQHTPLEVTVAPPSAETLPPLIAEVEAIVFMAYVDTMARDCVINNTSSPYDVPRAFVA